MPETPTAQEISEKLIEIAYIWGDIEEKLELLPRASGDDPGGDLGYSVGKAFRVEAKFGRNGWDDPCVFAPELY